jgi:hypothetical protein
MYWELRHYFGKGAALKITDGSGNAWYIIPRSSMASWTSHVELSGSVPGGSLTFKLKASGIGVLYDVYKGPSKTVMANFSTFTTLSSGSFTSNSFRIILYGTSSLLRKIDLFVPGPNLKRVWIKPLWCADILQSTANPQSANYRIAFDAGRTYRIAMIANFGYASGTFGNFTFHNHYSDFTTTYQINQIQQLTGAAGSYEDFHRFIDFVAVGEDLCIRYYQATGVGGAMGPVGGTIAGYHTWGFDHLLIEEV